MDKVYIESHIEATIDWVTQCHKVATVRDVDTEEVIIFMVDYASGSDIIFCTNPEALLDSMNKMSVKELIRVYGVNPVKVEESRMINYPLKYIKDLWLYYCIENKVKYVGMESYSIIVIQDDMYISNDRNSFLKDKEVLETAYCIIITALQEGAINERMKEVLSKLFN